MAKRIEKEPREETKKQAGYRRKDQEANRRLLFGLLGVGVVLLLIILAGVIQELVIKPRQPVATINGQRIGLQDYQKQVRFNWFQTAQQGQPVSDPQGAALQVLDQMIDLQLLREQAAQRGITVTEEEITARVEEAFGFYRQTPTPWPTSTPDPNATATPAPEGTAAPTSTPAPTATPYTEEAFREQYQTYMDTLKTSSGMTEADWRMLVESDLLQSKLYDEVTKDVPTTGEQVHARHILIAIRTPAPEPVATATPGPDATATPAPDPAATATPLPTPTPAPRTDAEALQLAQEIRQRLAAGEDFAALAAQFSDDTGSAADGGDLSWFARDEGLVKEFEDAAFALQPGQISEPVLTQFGYHIIKVEERDAARELNLYTVYQKKQEAFDTWLADLRTAATVERNWSLDKLPPTPLP